MKVGVDASAAAGPVGRQAAAGTDLSLSAEILSYSRARGAFVGVSIDGSVISLDPSAEAIYYQPPGTFPASAMTLLQTVNASAVAPAVAPVVVVAPACTRQPRVDGCGRARRRRCRSRSATARTARISCSRSSPDSGNATWHCRRQVHTPNRRQNPQETQQYLRTTRTSLARSTIRGPADRPEFQQTLAALRRYGEVRTASNTAIQLPPPPT